MSVTFFDVLILEAFLDPCLQKRRSRLMLTCQLVLLFKPKFFLVVCISMTEEHWSCRCALQAGSFGTNPLIMTYQ